MRLFVGVLKSSGENSLSDSSSFLVVMRDWSVPCLTDPRLHRQTAGQAACFTFIMTLFADAKCQAEDI